MTLGQFQCVVLSRGDAIAESDVRGQVLAAYANPLPPVAQVMNEMVTDCVWRQKSSFLLSKGKPNRPMLGVSCTIPRGTLNRLFEISRAGPLVLLFQRAVNSRFTNRFDQSDVCVIPAAKIGFVRRIIGRRGKTSSTSRGALDWMGVSSETAKLPDHVLESNVAFPSPRN